MSIPKIILSQFTSCYFLLVLLTDQPNKMRKEQQQKKLLFSTQYSEALTCVGIA